MKHVSLSDQLDDHLENSERMKPVVAALKEAKEIIKVWHGPDAWEIYDQHSRHTRIERMSPEAMLSIVQSVIAERGWSA